MIATRRPALHGFLATGRCCHPESWNCRTKLPARPTVLTTAALRSPRVSRAMRREAQTSEGSTSPQLLMSRALRMSPAKDALTIRRPSKAVVL